MEGNPIAFNPDIPIRIYVAAFLPQLKYYNYICIKNSERTTGAEMFRRELREIVENEQGEIAERELNEKSIADEIRLSDSFVEFLNEHQLFYSLFENNAEGKILMMIGEEAQDLFDKYCTEAFSVTQKIYELGLDKYRRRCREIKEFNECVDEAKFLAQKNGQE